MDNVKIIKKENNDDVLYLEVEYIGQVYNIMVRIDEKDNWHFFYENGEKPKDTDFEYNLMCSL